MRGFASMSRSLVVSLGLACVSGCGDAGGGGGETGGTGGETGGTGGATGGSAPIPVEEGAEALARTLCALEILQCSCASSTQTFGGFEGCVEARMLSFGYAFDMAAAEGAQFDPVCMAGRVDFFRQTIGCKTLIDLVRETVPLGWTCKAFSGEGDVGEACVTFSEFGDTCRPGLRCYGDVCEVDESVTETPEGGACTPGESLCEPGTRCEPPSDEPTGPTTCVRQPGLGEPCSGFCDVGLYCTVPMGGGQAACAPLPGAGEPCAGSQCAEGLYCDQTVSVCSPPRKEGESCTSSFACEPGFGCTDPFGDGVCQREAPYVCA